MNPNYEALLTLIGDVNNTFAHVEEEDAAAICDGDMQLLDKAVKNFKLKVWDNQQKANAKRFVEEL